MKIDKINDTDYKIYIFKYNEAMNIDIVKVLINKLKDKLKLSGFYRVIVINKKIGTFIEIVRIEKSFYKNVLDLKIIIEEDKVYFKTDDYFKIKDMNNIKYHNNNYYVLVDDSFSDIIEKVEFGEFIFGDGELSLIDNFEVI